MIRSLSVDRNRLTLTHTYAFIVRLNVKYKSTIIDYACKVDVIVIL